MNDWVVIGRFGRVHGIKGFIQVHSFTDPLDNIFEYQPWFINLKKTWCPIKIHQEQNNGHKFLVQVENYMTREEASFLTNMEIAVPRHVLPELNDEFYHHDLIGLKVYNDQQEYLGEITDIFVTGASDVLVISGESQYLIPFVMNVFIQSIDLDKHQVLVHWDLSDSK